MRLKTLTSAFACALALSATPVWAQSGVVATIQPVHSLVSSVMKGVGEPSLIIDKTMSPHTMSLKPSQAKELQDAKIIFWVGDELETSLAKPIDTIGEKARIVELIKADGIKLLDFREHDDLVPGEHDHGHDDHKDEHAHEEGHDHDHDKEHAHKDEHDHDHDHKAEEGHDHKHEEAHNHEEGHDHKHEEHAEKDEHDHAGHDDHEGHHHHDGTDPHIWLNTNNAVAMTRAIEKSLSEVFPDNAETFAKNADETVARLEALAKDIPAKLHADHARPALVFHDAYHYFEDQFGFEIAGVINLSPASSPGAKHLTEIREAVKDNKVACIYTEPQFSTKMAESIAEGTDIKLAISDPLGADLVPGPDQYFQLLNNLASSFGECFEHDH